MKRIYTKTLLYAYPNISAVIRQIDDLVQKKALASMMDFSPCVEQCEKIIKLTSQKVILNDIKNKIESFLVKLSKIELDCVEYKYFKNKPKEYFIDFDFSSRAYFRRQNSIVKKVSNKLEKAGITDQVFEGSYLKINFIKELLKRVTEQEKLSIKNKPKTYVKEKVQNSNLPLANETLNEKTA